MKKTVLGFMLAICITNVVAQETSKDSIVDGWKTKGNVTLTFNQSAFNNEWTGGGIGNTAANVLLNYDFNYTKDKYVWDTKLIVDYGVNKNKGDEKFSKNNDRLELNSLVGKNAKKNWYYSMFFNLKTQLDSDVLGTSHFFSPVYFQSGLGMLWKKSDNLHVNISPVAAKLTVVHDEFAGTFGTDANETSKLALGASIRAYYKTDIMKNISMENILALYSDYLETPKNIDIDYTMNMVMKVNKYISANITFQAIYDDDINAKGFQIRETLGLGLNYAF